MRKTTYCCDQCDKVIGDKAHYSLHFAQYSGIAVPEKRLDIFPVGAITWSVKQGLNNQFTHFCSTPCLTKWFDGKMKASIKVG